MFNPTLNNIANKSLSTDRLKAIAKPLALMAVLLSVSPAAFAVRDCNEDETVRAGDYCFGEGGTLGSCAAHADGSLEVTCDDVPGGGTITVYLESDGELPEDDYRGEPTDTSTSPGAADELVDEELGLSDDDGGIRGADDGDTDPDESLEIGACCVDLSCIDDLTEDQCEDEELGAWFASMDCADTHSTECATLDPGPTRDDADASVGDKKGLLVDDSMDGNDFRTVHEMMRTHR